MTTTPIRPFTVSVPQADLDDLRERLERTRFAATVPGDDWTYGTPTAYLQDMVARWKDLDWRAVEERANAHPSFVTEIDGQKKEIKIKEFQSQQPITIALSKDSSMRRLTPEMIAALASPGKGSGDLQEMFDQLPTFTLQDLKPGDSILISSTKGADPTRITAIAVVSGVGPLLQNKQTGRATAVSLGAMSLGGP